MEPSPPCPPPCFVVSPTFTDNAGFSRLAPRALSSESISCAAMRSSVFRLLSSRLPSYHRGGRRHMSETPSSISYDRGIGYVKYLRALQNCASMDCLKNVQSLLIVNGLTEQDSLVGEMIRACFRLEDSALAVSVYCKVGKFNLGLQNLVLRCLADHGSYEELLSLYRESQVLGVRRSDHFTYPFVIKACAALRLLRAGKEVHCTVLRTGYGRNAVVQTALLDMYGKAGSIEIAQHVFNEISERDLVSWNALLSGYSSNGLNEKALEIYRQICTSSFKPNVSTLVSVIPVCTRIGAFQMGKSLHAFAFKSGVLSSKSLTPTLMSMYASCSELSVCRMLFEMLPEKDVVSWNSMVSAYTQCGKCDEAFTTFNQMLCSNVNPTLLSFVSILPSCYDLGDAVYGESLHAQGIKHGFTSQISVKTSLMTMYAKLGNLDAARYLFFEMPEKNLLAWNSMISGCSLNGCSDMALATFHDMLVSGIMPDSISMVSLLSACCQSERLITFGESVHAFVLRNSYDSDLNVMNALLAMYRDCGQSSSSLKLLHNMSARNLVSWNTLISGSARTGDIEASIAFFHQMLEEGIGFDLVTLISILPILYGVKNLTMGMSFHGHAIKISYDCDASLCNALISMYMNCSDIKSGYMLFDLMAFKCVVSWNAVLTGLRNHKLFNEAVVLFSQMQMDGWKPNTVTLLNVLPMCRNHLQGKSIHGYAVRNFNGLDPSLLTSIMCMYATVGNLNACFLLFEAADKGNIAVWNTIMSILVLGKSVQRAVTCFKEMLKIETRPDPVTLLTLVSACAQISSIDLAQCLTGYVVRRGFGNNTAVVNSLIDMHARCGNILMAREIFDGLRKKDSISWSSIINGYGLHGDGAIALSLFGQMQGSGVEPDDVAFVSILSACSHNGLVEQASMLFNSMLEKHHIRPQIEHYACMIDLFSRTGKLDIAYDLIKPVPINQASSLLESMLGACSHHCNISHGEKIARLLFEVDPNNPRAYVMLSNMYAAAGMWFDSDKLRCDMETRGLRKDSGFSLLEV